MRNSILAYCSIRNGEVVKNGELLHPFESGKGLSENLKTLYRNHEVSYPKFFKMDLLCKLGFITSEILFDQIGLSQKEYEDMGVLLANSTASLHTDREHQNSISDRNKYTPSPSVFVYTLPNIVMGEICIRRKIMGENTFLIFDKFEPDFIRLYADQLINTYKLNYLLIGWIDVLQEKYESFLALISGDVNSTQAWSFSVENLSSAFNNNLK